MRGFADHNCAQFNIPVLYCMSFIQEEGIDLCFCTHYVELVAVCEAARPLSFVHHAVVGPTAERIQLPAHLVAKS